jgi:hypothetical protein
MKRKYEIGKAFTEKEVAESFKKTKASRKKAGKSYEIIKASPKPWHEFNAINVDGKRLEFGKQTNALRTRDKALAMDIKQALGGRPGEADVVVAEVDDVPRPGGEDSKSFFAVPELPWHKEGE